MGRDSYPNIRYPHRHTPGGQAYLPDIESVSVDTSQCMLLVLLDHFFQVLDLLTHTNLNREVPVGFVENPTPEFELVI